MGLYEELKADAYALLAELGQDMALVRPGEGQSYDPVLGRPSNAADQTFPAKGVIIDYTAQEIDGTVVLAGDRKVILQAVEQPKPNDRLKVGTETTWNIVRWTEVAPAGLALIYQLQVRR